MTIASTATVEVDFTGKFEVYTPNDVRIAGQAIVNTTNQPKNFVVNGTTTKENGQTFALAGEGMMEAVFNFPNGKAQITGQGDLAGSIVANELLFTGQMAVHYDESLGSTTGDGRGITSWHELSNPKHVIDIAKYVKDIGIIQKVGI